ncbi:uncharacterized protein [Salvelinus sp. IW2-2015]|uniref:uncharacterized protein isoform X1 n=1 Tax=Salvelinus sp. IW2-2015 TaxID=2691554 RepID=UPI000CEA8C32|nr:uncharacterized protein LOC112071297 [Salvelinus alpinus]
MMILVLLVTVDTHQSGCHLRANAFAFRCALYKIVGDERADIADLTTEKAQQHCCTRRFQVSIHKTRQRRKSTMSEEIIHTTYKHMEVSGKIAAVKNSLSPNQLVIIVKDMQNTEKINHEVTVYHLRRDSKSVELAFSFMHNNQRLFSVVDGDEVKLERKPDVQTAILDKRCLFQWHKKSGEWGILKSVAEPQKSLCIVDDKVTVGPLENMVTFRLTSK